MAGRVGSLACFLTIFILVILSQASRASWEITNDDQNEPAFDGTLEDDPFAAAEGNDNEEESLLWSAEEKEETMMNEGSEVRGDTLDGFASDDVKAESTDVADGETEVKAELEVEAGDNGEGVPNDQSYRDLNVEVYGGDEPADDGEIDCNDVRFMGSIDCVSSAADANLSKEGLKAKQELLSFMELRREKRQAGNQNNVIFDEGSGTGEIYPESTAVTDGNYTIESSISFNLTSFTNTTTMELELQLLSAYRNVTGVIGVTVTEIGIVNGTLVAKYEIKISGSSISGFGTSLQNITDNLRLALENVTRPAYEVIEIGGQRPLEPFNPTIISQSVGNKLMNICESDNPCPETFAQCQSTGVDEGRCLHFCTIFEQDQECQHGGTCELDVNLNPFCSCTANWKGNRCQDAVTSKDLNTGEIAGATIGAVLVIIGLVGCCCWCLLCRKGTRNINMTHYTDDASGSDKFSNPSSKISTFVIDRPRISASPFNAFNPGHHSSSYQATSNTSRRQSIGWKYKTKSARSKPSLFSDA